MKKIPASILLYGFLLMCGAGAVSQTAKPASGSGIYYKPVPSALTKQIAIGLARCSRDYPLPPSEQRRIANVVIRLEDPAIDECQYGAIPVSARFLESDDAELRWRAMFAIITVLKEDVPEPPKIRSLIIKITQRSLLDRDTDVRIRATTNLMAIGHLTKENVPMEVITSLKTLMREDPSKGIRRQAHALLSSFGVLPPMPSVCGTCRRAQEDAHRRKIMAAIAAPCFLLYGLFWWRKSKRARRG